MRTDSDGQLQRLIVTGANGVGKSHFARDLALARPGVRLISFDAIKLRTGWQQRSRTEIAASLDQELRTEAWILEGGPSLLPLAIGTADALVWLDPPEPVRAWRLLTRPFKHVGKTRPELPSGNVDWPWQQYRFALRSLRNGSQLRAQVCAAFRDAEGLQTWRCRSRADLDAVLSAWTGAGR